MNAKKEFGTPKEESKGLVASVLMCHAPIVIPEIGGAEGKDCIASTHAMKAAAQFCLEKKPHLIVVISPHSPRAQRGFSYWGQSVLRGSFSQFGHPDLNYKFSNQQEFIETLGSKLSAISSDSDMSLTEIKTVHSLDHGALVPLHFLIEVGWQGPTVILGLPWKFNDTALDELGRCIAKTFESLRIRGVIVASGDMSHRLKKGAPAGFHPEAKYFDQSVVEKVQLGDYGALNQIDGDVRENAAEDVLDTLRIAAASTNYESEGHKVLSYEAPFGVGYLISILWESGLTHRETMET